MGAVPKQQIHLEILAAAGGKAEGYSSLTEVPFRLSLAGFGSLVFYAFNLTSPPGGRPIGEYKIQLIVPGQARGARGWLEFSSGAITILIGWAQEEKIFAMWDAYARESFSYSQNLQIKGESVWLAQVEGLSTSERHLRNREGMETIVACRSDRFLDGISTRVQLSAVRLGGMEFGL